MSLIILLIRFRNSGHSKKKKNVGGGLKRWQSVDAERLYFRAFYSSPHKTSLLPQRQVVKVTMVVQEEVALP